MLSARASRKRPASSPLLQRPSSSPLLPEAAEGPPAPEPWGNRTEPRWRTWPFNSRTEHWRSGTAMDAWLGFFLRLLLVVSVSRFPVSANRRFGEFGTFRVGSRVFLLSCRSGDDLCLESWWLKELLRKWQQLHLETHCNPNTNTTLRLASEHQFTPDYTNYNKERS